MDFPDEIPETGDPDKKEFVKKYLSFVSIETMNVYLASNPDCWKHKGENSWLFNRPGDFYYIDFDSLEENDKEDPPYSNFFKWSCTFRIAQCENDTGYRDVTQEELVYELIDLQELLNKNLYEIEEEE